MRQSPDNQIGNLIRSTLNELPVEDVDPLFLRRATAHRRRQRRLVASTAISVAVIIGVVAALLSGAGDHKRTHLVTAPAPSTTVPNPARTIAPAPASTAGLLARPLHLPAVTAGQSCPATHGQTVSGPYFDGVELGRGLVRPLMTSAGQLRRGVVYIYASDRAGRHGLGPRHWYAIQNFWYSQPSYQGPWVVRGQKLGGPGRVLFGDSSPTGGPQIVPAGPTANTFGPGYRTAVGSTWVKGPGCYGFQVDGLSFSEVIVIDVVYHAEHSPLSRPS